MKKPELIELIENGENSGLEFKRDDIRPEQLAKEVTALANFQGGSILLGVEDSGDISGLQRDYAEEWVMNVFRDKIHPMMLPFYEEIQMEEGKRIAVISFPQGVSKPYVVRHGGRELVYIRLGTTSQSATREQQIRLFASGGLLHTEKLLVAGTSIKTLDIVRLENYLRDIIEDPEVPENEAEWQTRLLGLGFLTEGINDQPVCTVAGLVLFGIKPRRYLKQAGVWIMFFRGKEKEYQASLDTILDAPMAGRWQADQSGRTLVDEGLIEKFSALVKSFITEESAEIDQYMRREEKWFYPFEAVRETVINALVHRDWTRSVDIEICGYEDRLEIISPGALPNTMTIDKMKAGQRSMRNQIITEVLRDYRYVDARGMGIRTKVIPLMKHLNNTEPIFNATEDFLKTVLLKKT